MRVAAAPVVAMLMLSFASLSSSSDSQADGLLFTRSHAALEQMWGSVLRCAVREDDDTAVERSLESGSVPARASHDYSECGKQALRNTGSRIIVNTIEDALYQGGLAFVGDDFQLESSLQWVFGGNVRGEVDLVLPLWTNSRSEGEGSALFAQHGVVFWQGLGEESRTDGNFGIVYRSHLTSDVIGGGSLFYDYDFRRGHSRLGVGVDAQSGGFYGNFNYYHPLTAELEGREEKYTAYFERALRGLDATLAYRRNRLRLSGSLGYWHFEGSPESQAQWYPSYEVDAGFLVLPGVFLEGGYEHHEDGKSLGSRWSAGMLFQFSLPNLDGATVVDGSGIPRPNLWRAVEREKRILYEEYERGPGVSLRYSGERLLSEEAVAPQAEMMIVLSEALEGDVELHLVGAGTATYGTDSDSDDWEMSYRVVPATETTRPNSPSMTDCEQASESAPCTIVVPAGGTMVELHVTLHDEGEYEDAETVRISVVVPSGYARFLTARGATQEITIGANLAPTVSLTYEGAPTISEEGGAPGTANMEVRVSEALPRDIVVGFTEEGTADFGDAPNDWFFQYPDIAGSSSQPLDCNANISRCVLTIPAGQTEAQVTVNVNDDNTPEDPENLTLGITLSSQYADVARLGDPSEQTVIIAASERNIAFGAFDPLNPVNLETDVEEGTPVEIEIALDPAPVPITVVLEGGPNPGSHEDADADDLEFPADVVIPANTSSHNFTVTAVSDGIAEPIEEIFLNIVESPRRPLPIGWSIMRTPQETPPNQMRIEIAANGNTIVWDPAGSFRMREDGGAQTVKLVVDGPLKEPAQLRLRPANASTAVLQPSAEEEGDYMYSVTSGGTFSFDDNMLEIPAHSGEGPQEVEITITPRDNPDADGNRTILFEIRGDSPDVPVGWGIGAPRGTASSLEVTIVDDEPPNRGEIAFARAGSRVTEGTSFDIPVSVTGIVGTTFNVMVTAQGALEDAQIQGTSGPGIETPYRFAVDGKSSNLGIDIADNTIADGNREIVFTLASTRLPPGVRFGEQLTHTLIIIDDEAGSGSGDILPVRHSKVGFAGDSTDVTEDASDKTINIPIVASAAPASPFDLIISVLDIGDNPATEGADFTVPSSVQISGGGETNLPVEILADGNVETRETIVLEIDTDNRGFPVGFTFGSRTRHTINIIANGNIIEFADPLTSNATEGGEDAIVNISIDLPLPRGRTGSVNVEVEDGTGVTAADDYRIEGPGYDPSTGILRFPETDSVALTVTARNDTDVEEEETVTLRLVGNSDTPAGWSIGTNNEHVVTLISDYDAPERGQAVGFAIPGASETFNPVRIFEEETTGGSAHGLTVRVVSNEAAPRGGIDLAWTVTSGADQLVPASRVGGDVDFARGDEFQEFDIMIESDSVTEPPVPVTLRLSSPTGLPSVWSYGKQEYTFTIESSDGTVGFASTDPVMVDEGEPLTIELTSDVVAPSTGIPVSVTVQGSSPAADLSIASDITIPAGQNSYNLDVEILSDGLGEEAEEYIVSIATGTNFPVGWGTVSGSRTVTIRANENTIGIGSPNSAMIEEADSATIEEGGSGTPNSMTVPVAISNTTFLANALASNITLAHTLGITGDENHTALDDVMFTDVVLDAGTGGGSASIEVSLDGAPELEEVVTVTIVEGSTALPEGWSIDPDNNTYTVTIPANDNTIGFALANSTAVEEASTGVDVHITINNPLPSGATASVMVGTTNQGGAVNADYEITGTNYSNGILTLPVSPDDTATLTVRAISDLDIETGESVRLTLTENAGSFPDGWEIGTAEHVTAFMDKGGTIGFDVPSRLRIPEVDSGLPDFAVIPMVITDSAILAAALTEDITLTHTISIPTDEDNDPEDDVLFTDVVLDAETGEGTARLEVSRDTALEVEEVVTITIMEGATALPTGWTVDTNNNTYTITIPANDNTVGFASESSTITEGSSATVDISVDMPLPAGIAPSVNVDVMNRGGVSDSDYEITAVGYSNGILTLPVSPDDTATLTVRVTSDSEDETGEGVRIILTENNNSFPEGWEIGTNEHRILFEDPPPKNNIGFAAREVEVAEGGTVNVVVAVRDDDDLPVSSLTADIPLSLTITDPDGDTDFHTNDPFFVPGGETFTDGEVQIASFGVREDALHEDEEEITLVLGEGTNFPSEDWEIDANTNQLIIRISASGNTVGFASESSFATEGDPVGTVVSITINQPFPAGTTASVRVALTNQGGAADSDYVISGTDYSNGILTLPVSPDDTANLIVRATTDTDTETGEGVLLTLSENNTSFPAGWELGTHEHLVEFDDADPRNSIGFRDKEIVVTEGTASARQFVNPFAVMRDADGTPITSVIPTTIPLSLTISDPGNDTQFTEGDPVTIGGGSAYTKGEVQLASFAIRLDGRAEPEDRIVLRLGERGTFPSDDWVIDKRANELVIVIPAHDNVIGFASASSSVLEEDADGVTIDININTPLPSGAAASALVGITNQGGADANDYEITGDGYSNGVLTLPETPDSTTSLTVRAIADGITETGESILLTLTENNDSFPEGWDFGTHEHTVRFNDTAQMVTVDEAVTDTVVTEADTGSAAATATVRLAFPEALPSEAKIRVSIVVIDSSNTANFSPLGYSLTALNSLEGSFASGSDRDLATIVAGATGFGFSVTIPNDANRFGETVHLLFSEEGDTLPETWDLPPSTPPPVTIRVLDAQATAVGFAESTLTYDTAVVTVNISSDPLTAFPEGIVLVVENSDETGTVIEAGPQVPLEKDQMQSSLEIKPLGGTSLYGDVTLTLTDPNNTLPGDWRIGSNNTLTLTRGTPPSANTINLFSAAGGNVVAEGGTTNLLVEAALPSSGGTAFPPEGIELSLTVETNLADRDDTEDDPDPCPDYNPYQACIDNFEVSANLASKDAQDFERDGQAFPPRDPVNFPILPFPDLDPTVQPNSTRKYTFTLVQEPATTENPSPGNPAAGVFAAIPEDIGIEPEETITVTLAAEGTLPSGWTLGTTSYQITVPANGERIGFASNLPTTTSEHSTLACPTPFGSLSNEIYARLPFETLYDDGTQNTFDVSVTGKNHDGTPVSNIYTQVEVTGQVSRTTREFTVRGNGRVNTTDIGIFICADDTAELAQTLTVEVMPGQQGSSVFSGALMHEITVVPSDNTITIEQPSSALRIAQQNGTATIGVTINNQIPASGASPQVLIEPSSANGAVPDDYSLSVSGGSLETIEEFRLDTEKHLWTLPTGTSNATLTVTSDIVDADNKKADLALDFRAVNPTLGWDVVLDTGATETTRTIALGNQSAFGTVGFVESSSSVAESSTIFNVPIMVSTAPSSSFNLAVNVTNSSAADAATAGTSGTGADFSIPATVTISESGRTNLEIEILDDIAAEADETIVLEIPLSGHQIPAGLTRDSAAATHTVTILSNDNNVAFASSSSTATETRADATVTIDVDLPFPAGTEASVRIETENGGGATAADYEITGAGYSNGVLRLPETGSATLTVRAVAEFVEETGESVTLKLSEHNDSFPEGWEIGTPREHVVTLSDQPLINTIGFTQQEIEVEEGDPVSPTVVLRDASGSLVTSVPTAIPLELAVTPSGSTSYLGDPVRIPGGVLFQNGQVTITSFNVIRDNSRDVRQEITASLSPGAGFPSSNWEIIPRASRLTIVVPAHDNNITFSRPAPPRIREDGGSTIITASIVHAIPEGTTPTPVITITPTSGNLVEGTDYELSVPSDSSQGSLVDNNNGTWAWTLPTGADNAELTVRAISNIEIDSTLGLRFAAETLPEGWTVVGTTSHTVTITNEDSTIQFAESGSNTGVNEGDVSGDNTFVLTFSEALPADARIAIDVSGVKGSSGVTDTSDYTFALIRPSGSSFDGNVAVARTGTRELAFSIVIPEDADVEDEAITLTLSEDVFPSFWRIGTRSQWAFTVTDNDMSGTIGIGTPNTVSLAEAESGSANSMAIPVVVSDATRLASLLASDLTLAHTLSISGDENDDPEDDVVVTDVVLDATAGTGSASIEVSRDVVREVQEEVTVTITTGETRLPDGWTIDPNNNTYTVTVPANDNTIEFAPPFISSIPESTGTTSITAIISGQIPAGETATVAITPTSTNLTEGTHYELTVPSDSSQGSLADDGTTWTWTLPTGADSAELTVTAISDISANSTLSLAFAAPATPLTGWQISGLTQEITITDSATPAAPVVGFVGPTSTVVEEPYFESCSDDGCSVVYPLTVSASQRPTSAAVIVEVLGSSPASGGATNGIDYSLALKDTFVEFVHNNTADPLTKTVEVRIWSDNQRTGANRDTAPEGDETFTLTLGDNYVNPAGTNSQFGLTENGHNFAFAQNTHTFTILANNNTVGFASGNSSITEGGTGSVTVAVNLPLSLSAPASVYVDITENGSTVPGDYTVTGDNYSGGVLTLPIESDSPNNSATLTVTTVDGTVVSGDGITLTLRERGNSFPPGWEIGKSAHAVRFIESGVSQTLGFAQASSSAFEGDSHSIEFDVTGYAFPDAGFLIEDMGITGALGDATYNGSALVDDLDVTVVLGADAGDNPHFVVQITEDGTWPTSEAAETVTFTLPDVLGSGLIVGANTSHTLTIEPSNNRALFDSEGGRVDNSGTIAENATKIDAIVTLFQYGAPTGGLPLKFIAVDSAEEPIQLDTTSLVSLSSDLDNPASEVEFTVPAGATRYSVPVYVRDNATLGANDLARFVIVAGDDFPTGWGEVSTQSNNYALTVVDDEGNTLVGFSPAEGTVSEASDGVQTVTTNMTITPAPTGEVAIPVTFSGNADSYAITSDPVGAFSRTNNTTGTVTFAAGGGSVELTLTAQEDSNGVTDVITVGLPADSNLPGNIKGAGATWTVEVVDKGPNTVGWLGYSLLTRQIHDTDPIIAFGEDISLDLDENETDYVGVGLYIVLKDSDGNIFSRENNGVLLPMHDARFAASGSIDPPVTFVGRVTGSAYEGLFRIYNREPLTNDNIYLGAPRMYSSTGSAELPSGGLEITGFDFTALDDTDPELTENIVITLGERADAMLPEGWAFETGRDVLTLNILPNDNRILLASTSPSNAEEYADGTTGTDATIEFNVNLPPETGNVVLNVTPTFGGGAVAADYMITADGDYHDTGVDGIGLWTLPPGMADPALTVKAFDDTFDDDGEFVTFAISLAGESVGWEVGTDSDNGTLEYRVDFVDNDDETTLPTGTAGFEEVESRVSEVSGGTTHNVPVTVSAVPATPFDLVINVDTSASTATQGTVGALATGDDFTVPATLNISGAGETNFVVTILDDGDPELDQTIVLDIPSTGNGLPMGFTLGTNKRHTVTISPNDNTIGFTSPASATISENGGVTSVAVSIDINQQLSSRETAKVSLTTSSRYNIFPGAGAGYSNGVLTLPPSRSPATFIITAIDNDDIEDEVELTITMGDDTIPDGWTLDSSNNTFTLTITDDEVSERRTVSFSKSASPVLAQGGSGDQVDVTIDPAPSVETMIPISVAGDSDAFSLSVQSPSGAAWDGATSMLTFPAGEGTVTLAITPETDTDAVSDTITATLNQSDLPPGHDVGDIGTWTVEIAEGTVGFQAGTDANANEGDRINFTLELSSELTAAATLTLGVSATGITSTSAYTLSVITPSAASLSGSTLTVPSGNDSVTLSILIPEDTNDDRETVTLEVTDITAPAGWKVGSASAHEISVADNDSAVGFVLERSTVRAPADRTTPAKHFVEITLPESPAADVSLNMARSGTAIYGATSEWFSETPLPIVFTAGAKGADLTKRYEIDVFALSGSTSKTATLTLSGRAGSLTAGGNNFTLASPNNFHTVTIEPPATIGFTADESNVDEAATTHNVPLTITAAPDSAFDLVINASGGATEPATKGTIGAVAPGDDFTVPATLSISSGTASFGVTIIDDSTAEYDEFIVLEIPSENNGLPPGFTLAGHTSHTVKINANDNTVSFASGLATTLAEGNDTTGINLAINVDEPALETITLNIDTTSGTAVLGTDFTISGANVSGTTLSIPAGRTSDTITLTSINNMVDEANKSIILSISGGSLPDGWGLSPDPLVHTVTLTDDDETVPTIGWVDPGPHTITAPASGFTDFTAMLRASASPTQRIIFTTVWTPAGVDDLISGSVFTQTFTRGGCTSIEFAANASGDDLTAECLIQFKTSASGTITLTVSSNDLAQDGFVITEPTITFNVQ